LNHEKRLESVERMVNQLIKDYSVIEEFFKLIERLSREIESGVTPPSSTRSPKATVEVSPPDSEAIGF
jgi:hypothetical protein